MGSNYNYGPGVQGEYLCIVSKGIDSSSLPVYLSNCDLYFEYSC